MMADNPKPVLSIAVVNLSSETVNLSLNQISNPSISKSNGPSRQLTTRKPGPKKVTTIKTSNKASHIIKTPVRKVALMRKSFASPPSTQNKSALKHSKTVTKKNTTEKTKRKRSKAVHFSTADYTWQCWQCFCAFSEETHLGEHLKSCDTVNQDQIIQKPSMALSGCPFCPRDGFQSDVKPFFFSDFNAHMVAAHAGVKSLVCPYCLVNTGSSLQDLTAHIILSHHVHWRPCPSSLVYMRTDDVSHRVVTCLGCGWCTFVLRANDAAKPPTSLSSHMNRCACKGGQVHLPHLQPLATSNYGRRVVIETLTKQAVEISRAFRTRFPGVRGFGDNQNEKPLPRVAMRYKSPLQNKSTVPKTTIHDDAGGNVEMCSKIGEINQTLASFTTRSPSPSTSSPTIVPPPPPFKKNDDSDLANHNISTQSILKSEKKQSPPPLIPQHVFAPRGVSFDVPLNLPPPPPALAHGRMAGGSKKSTNRVYVCPICGDNALSSLRERDEHLQAEHHGELVFPCQLCGMAYPLYIALRRHAVLKHASNFDAVLYGQPDAEPLDCPYCELVAFTLPDVLQQHLAKIHPDQVQHQAVVSAVASSIGPEDDDENDKDWTENGKPIVDKKIKLEIVGNVRRGGKSATSADFQSGDLLEDADLLESVESLFGPGGNGSASRGRGSRGGGNRSSRGGTRGIRGSRGESRGGKTKSAPLHQIQPQQHTLETNIYSSATTLLTDTEGRPLDDQTLTGSMGDQTNGGMVIMAMDPLEITLANTSGVYAPASCRLCGPQGQIVLDNPKELAIHFELDHNATSTCEQLGCQACGRIFFGPNHRVDLIGHFRIAHQEGQEEALVCPNQNSSGAGAMADSDLDAVLSSGCPAKFTSQRLLDSHLLTDEMVLPGWSCPLSLDAELVQALAGSGSGGGLVVDGFDPVVLATEIAADAAGQMILAYGCPICSRVFTGENCTARYLEHRSHCGIMVTEGMNIIQQDDPQQTLQ